ncbi:MAG: MarR family winged helix-turn-helix transcriptional regulator [Candidatus Moraniibacteriota bacterium]|jgi:DNA-binding MarR family transcriptional regulator
MQISSDNNTAALVQKESRVATLFIYTIAERMGLQLTDIRCLDHLMENQSATAGDIARVTGLTTGAVTAMIDRLEKINLVRRTADEKDRRKTIIILYNKNFHKSNIITNFFTKNVTELLNMYSTEEQELIADWNKKMTILFQDEIKQLNSVKSK